MNRLLEETDGVRITGQVFLDGMDIYDRSTDVTEVRTRIGMLAPKPFPLPMSIFENIAYGPRLHRVNPRNGKKVASMAQIVEKNLRAAGFWDEVKDRLPEPASRLSTGQQQRLCLARALAVEPEVLICDEPTSALDPISAQKIEDQLKQLKNERTIVVVTHLLRQARRLADYLIFLWMGQLVEAGAVEDMFTHPADERTRAYLSGQIG